MKPPESQSGNVRFWVLLSVPFLGGLLAAIFFLSSRDVPQTGDQADADVKASVRSESEAVVSEKSVEQATRQKRSGSLHVSVELISQVKDTGTVEEIHRQLAMTLITELEGLRGEKNAAKIRVSLKPTARKFYLLNRAIEVHGIPHPSFQTLNDGFAERIDALSTLWTENSTLGMEADHIYSQMGILNSEHVPYQLRNWLESSKRPQDL